MSDSFNQMLQARQARMKQSDSMQRWLFILLGAAALAALAYVVLRGDPSTRPVNPNTATIEQLITLPEIGPDLAQKIKSGGPYTKAEDLLQVKGIGPKTLEKMRPRLKFE